MRLSLPFARGAAVGFASFLGDSDRVLPPRPLRPPRPRAAGLPRPRLEACLSRCLGSRSVGDLLLRGLGLAELLLALSLALSLPLLARGGFVRGDRVGLRGRGDRVGLRGFRGNVALFGNVAPFELSRDARLRAGLSVAALSLAGLALGGDRLRGVTTATASERRLGDDDGGVEPEQTWVGLAPTVVMEVVREVEREGEMTRNH